MIYLLLLVWLLIGAITARIVVNGVVGTDWGSEDTMMAGLITVIIWPLFIFYAIGWLVKNVPRYIESMKGEG